MGKKEWVTGVAKKLSGGVDKAVKNAIGLYGVRNMLIGYAIIIAIVASPFLIYHGYKARNPEKFCAHEHLEISDVWYDFGNKAVRRRCSDCSAYVEVESQYRVIKDTQPTCSSVGILEERLLSGAGSEDKKTIRPRLPHTNELVAERVSPTCTQSGETALYRCTVCDAYSGGDTIAALGHTSVVSVKGYSPTCMITGRTAAYACSVCGAGLQASTIIPKVDHKCEVTTVPPEDYAMGYDLHECIWCDYERRDNYVAALIQVLKFDEYSDCCYVSGVLEKTESVEIPAYYNGKPVTGIVLWAFHNNDVIREITIPSTVTTIAERAFENCPNLEVIHFSEGLEAIESYAFWKCPGLRELTFPKSLVSMPNWAFAECPNIERVSFHEESAFDHLAPFSGAKKIVSVRLPGKMRFTSSTLNVLKGLPLLAEIYMSEDFKAHLDAAFLAKYIIKTDYSLESSVPK